MSAFYLDHAKREFKLAGWLPSRPGAAPDIMQKKICQHVLKLLKVFSNEGHSGSSAHYALSLFNGLAQGKNISPLTTSRSEWMKVSGRVEPDVWQNRRNSEAFSNDGGKTHYLLSERKRRNSKVVDVVKKTLTPTEVRAAVREREKQERADEQKSRVPVAFRDGVAVVQLKRGRR